MKKLAIITTGGTIGSILQSGSTSVDKSEQRIAQEIEHAKNRLGYSVEIHSPLNKNSEALYPSDWIKILACIEKANASEVDGIVVTHGTDTMAFSVAAAAIFNSHWDKKICFTGAFYPPDHPSSDTSLNLLAALQFAASDYSTNGVYVAFRSNRNNSQANIMRGTDIKPMAFDEEFFQSTYCDVIACFDLNNGLSIEQSINSNQFPQLENLIIGTQESIAQAQSRIACISLYPGIDKYFMQNATQGREILIIQMYHSGTGPADDSNDDLIQFLHSTCKNTVILMGTLPKKYIDTPYTSTQEIKESGAHIYTDLQPHFLYTFSLLALSTGSAPEDIVKDLITWEL